MSNSLKSALALSGCVLMSMLFMGAYGPTAATINCGGRTFIDDGTYTMLRCYTDSGKNCSFRKDTAGATGAFAGPFSIYCIEADVNTTGGTWALAQSDNDVGVNTTTALTTPVYCGGNATGATGDTSAIQTTALQSFFARSGDCSVASGKFLSTQNIGAASFGVFTVWVK